MTDEKWPQSDVGYDPTQTNADEARWQAAITASLSVGTLRLGRTNTAHRFMLRGECPRCGHDIGERELNFRRLGFNADAADDSEEILMEVRLDAEADDLDRPSFNIVCNCTRPHRARPKADSGCGWSGYSTVYIDNPQGGDGG